MLFPQADTIFTEDYVLLFYFQTEAGQVEEEEKEPSELEVMLNTAQRLPKVVAHMPGYPR